MFCKISQFLTWGWEALLHNPNFHNLQEQTRLQRLNTTTLFERKKTSSYPNKRHKLLTGVFVGAVDRNKRWGRGGFTARGVQVNTQWPCGGGGGRGSGMADAMSRDALGWNGGTFEWGVWGGHVTMRWMRTAPYNQNVRTSGGGVGGRWEEIDL